MNEEVNSQRDDDAVTPLALPADRCAALFGVSVRHWRAMDAAGLVPQAVRLGAAVRWRIADLRRWLEEGCPGRARFAQARDAAAKR